MLRANNGKIKKNLWLIIGSSLAGILMIISMSLVFLKKDLLREKELKTRHLVETAHAVLEHFHSRSLDGSMSEEGAKAAAIEAIRHLRYEEKEYFWINDMHPTMVMHPYRPDLTGHDLRRFMDPNGKKLFVEFVETVKSANAGFVYYLWPKPGFNDPILKVSYVKGFEPWGWIVGSGIYLDDVNALFWNNASQYAVAGMVTFFLILALSGTIAKNITRNEQAIRFSEEKFSKAFHASPDGIVISRKSDGLFLDANEAFFRMLEYSPEEALGRTSFELGVWVDPGERARIVERLDREGVVRKTEVRLRTKSGAVRTILWSSDSIDLNGEECLLVLLRDITVQKENEVELFRSKQAIEKAFSELKETQAHLLQQEKMASIGQLAAGVAHEINNPIGFITSNLKTLGKYGDRLTTFIREQAAAIRSSGRPEDVETVGALAKQLKIDHITADIPGLIAESLDGAERVKKIVQDLKSFSRVDEADFKLVDVTECIDSTVNIAWNELKYKVSLKKDYGEVPPLRCRPQQLNQVLMNLLLNASHAIEIQGEIVVRTWQENGSACISVSDSGCGIPEEIRSRIFEPFFTTKEVGKGTGLGLSISYDIVKKHGGVLDVDSAVGKGTTFTVRLPLEPQRA